MSPAILPCSPLAETRRVPQAGVVLLPLILTLALDDASSARFDALRAAHFPAERNHLAAHVTLFHALPGEHLQQVHDDVQLTAQRPAFAVRVTGLRSLGRGVAYVLDAPELAAVREALRLRWQPWLTPQDQQPHSPHVTVQNKVPPEQARALLTRLADGFEPYDVTATGLALWRYLGGPWEPLAIERFSSGSDVAPTEARSST